MATEARDTNVKAYVDNAHTCLRELPEGFYFDTNMEQNLIRRFNAERTKIGLAPLRIRAEMLPAARFHSMDMGYNTFFGHKSPNEKGHGFRISAFDRTQLLTKSAENVASYVAGKTICSDYAGNTISCDGLYEQQSPDPQTVEDYFFKGLMESEGHRANILDKDVTDTAVGIAYGNYGFYFTQVFSRPVGQLENALPLVIQATEPVPATAIVSGWNVANFGLGGDSVPKDIFDNVVPLTELGNRTLYVRARRVQTKQTENGLQRTTRTLYATGPEMTVVPPRGS
jgi:uncharacterized protein YkwD